MLSEDFWTPNIASLQFDEYSQLGSRRKVRPIKNQLDSPSNIRPIKNGLKGGHSKLTRAVTAPTMLCRIKNPATAGTRPQARSKDQEEEGGGGLDLQVSPEEIMSREVELGCESWTSFASSCSSTAMQRTLSL